MTFKMKRATCLLTKNGGLVIVMFDFVEESEGALWQATSR